MASQCRDLFAPSAGATQMTWTAPTGTSRLFRGLWPQLRSYPTRILTSNEPQVVKLKTILVQQKTCTLGLFLEWLRCSRLKYTTFVNFRDTGFSCHDVKSRLTGGCRRGVSSEKTNKVLRFLRPRKRTMNTK
jgi:hypothetical protein